MQTDWQELKQRIARARHLVVLTGAGASAESGVPTFRDALTGLWQNFNPADLATAEAFVRNRALVWGWYEWRRKLLQDVQPNAAHLAIAKMQQQAKKFTLITQNVDDLHERAGSQNVLHLHGSIGKQFCFVCRKPHPPAPATNMVSEQAVEPPRCQHCNDYIRPGVVWFGEALPDEELKQAYAAVKDCDVLLSVGTSGQVYPVAELPLLAAANGALVLHINPDADSAGEGNVVGLAGKAGEILPRLV